MPRESHLVQAILREFGSRPDLRLWRQNTGAARTPTGQVVRFGVPGQADIMGILAPSGRIISIEAKSATGRLSDAQQNWRAMIERFGGLAIVARNVDDVRTALLQAQPHPAESR